MKSRFFPPHFPCVVTAIAAIFAFAACGPDQTAPAIDTSSVPSIVFFNDTGSPEYYLFSGRASDNTNVDRVLISTDNGATWHTTDIDNSPPNKNWFVEWSYLASSSDLPAGMHTVLVRASDKDNNQTTSDPLILESQSGSTISSLQAVFIAATTGDVIGLSTGSGNAFGTSADALKIPIDVDLTVQGSGYGSSVTSGGLLPSADPEATILEAAPGTASLFSVDANLTIRKMRLLGAEAAVRVADVSGPDPQLSVRQCLFDRQAAWAVFVQDDDAAVSVEVADSIVDASQAVGSSRGGVYLDNVSYLITGSGFWFQTDPGGPDDPTVTGAGVQVIDGAGEITESLFDDNALAIWANAGSPVITSCDISGAAFTTNGINLTGGPGSALIRRNTIEGNTGYGLRVGGTMDLKLRKNAITGNGESGVLIDSALGNTSLTGIDMGTTGDRGNNLFEFNTHPDGADGQDTQVYVTLDTSEGPTFIPANWNYWGAATLPQVNLVIIDGKDDAARATLAIGTFWQTPGGEVGP